MTQIGAFIGLIGVGLLFAVFMARLGEKVINLIYGKEK